MSDDKRDTGTDPDFVDAVLEDVEVDEQRAGRPDAPNQNVVRPDGSGPGSPPDGTGGSTRPQQRGGTPEEREVRAQSEEAAGDDGEEQKKSESKKTRSKR